MEPYTKVNQDVKPLVVIIGPTASGKSSLAIDLALKFNGELICADSRTVYKGMDIGTAKPTRQDRDQVRHHLLDIVEPLEYYSAASFKREALELIEAVADRGKLPIMVGGTGLYVDSVMFDYAFLPPASPDDRQELECMTVEQLQEKIVKSGIKMPENSKNKRHLIRAIETNGEIPVKKGLRSKTLIIGLDIGREELKARLNLRVEKMVEDGFLEESLKLAKIYGWDAPGLQAPGYKAVRKYAGGLISLEEFKRQFVQNDFNLSKRQRTWFKRNSHIKWVQNPKEAEELVNNFLQNLSS